MKHIFTVGVGIALVATLFTGVPAAEAQTLSNVAQLQAQIDSLLKVLQSLQEQVARLSTNRSIAIAPAETAKPQVSTDGGIISPSVRLGAQFMRQSIPLTVTAGQTYPVIVKFKNTGTTVWDKIGTPGDYIGAFRIKSVGPYDNTIWGLGYVPLQQRPVVSGGEAIFSFTVTAPATPGRYNFQWQMNQGGVGWFGEVSPSVMVEVLPRPIPVSCSPETWEVPYGGTAYLTASGGNGSYSWSAPEGGVLLVTTGRQNEYAYRGTDRLPVIKHVTVQSGTDRVATCAIRIVPAPTEMKPLACTPEVQFAWSGTPVNVSALNLPAGIQPSAVVWSAPDGSPSTGTGQTFTVSFTNTTKYVAVNPVSVSVGGRTATCYVRVSNQGLPPTTDR